MNPVQRTLSGVVAYLNSNKWADTLVVVLALILGFLAAPIVLILMWGGYYSFRRIGLTKPARWLRTIAGGLAIGTLLHLIAPYTLVPLTHLVASFIEADSVAGRFGTQFDQQAGQNWQFFVLALSISWIQAGFFEEFIYRGFLLNKLSELTRTRWIGWSVAVILSTSFFALGHLLYRGVESAVFAALAFLALTAVYLLIKKQLWVIIVAHGSYDTLVFSQRFLD